MAIDFKDLRKANYIRDVEWGNNDDAIDLAFRGLELAGEVGEACNEMKKIERDLRGLVGGQNDLGPLTDELADVIICVDLVCMHLDIDLAEAVRRKFNKTSAKHNFETVL